MRTRTSFLGFKEDEDREDEDRKKNFEEDEDKRTRIFFLNSKEDEDKRTRTCEDAHHWTIYALGSLFHLSLDCWIYL